MSNEEQQSLDDIFIPEPDAFYNAVVEANDGKFLVIRSGDIVMTAPWQKVKAPGCHHCPERVPPGSTCGIRMTFNHGQYWVKEAIIDRVGKYFETSTATITRWNGAGLGERDCSAQCTIMVIPGTHPVTGQPTHREIRVGDRVLIEIKPSNDPERGWVGFAKKVFEKEDENISEELS